MTVVLVKMAHFVEDPAICHEAALPAITTLKSLSGTIQEAFDLGRADAFEYEVLGCRSPGCRGRLRDLMATGITRFGYLHHGAPKTRIEIAIIPMPRAGSNRSIA